MPVNDNGHDRFDGWRTQPMYTFQEAARLAHVSPSTVRNWLFGYTTKAGQAVSPLMPSQEQIPRCSFLQLVEIVVAAQFRKAAHKSYQTVRRAYENARDNWQLEYPFAHLRLESLGGHIVHVIQQGQVSFQAVDQLEQWSIPGLVKETISRLEYESDLAARWYPVGKAVPIVVDPRISSGVPVVLGRGVTIEVIHKRFKAGQRIDFIAKDFELANSIVEDVLRYAEKVAA